MKSKGQQKSGQLELPSGGGEETKPLVQGESTVQGIGGVTDPKDGAIHTEPADDGKLSGSDSGRGTDSATSNGTASDNVSDGDDKRDIPNGDGDPEGTSGEGANNSSQVGVTDKGADGGGNGEGKDGGKPGASKTSEISATAKDTSKGGNEDVISLSNAGGKGDSGISNKDANGKGTEKASSAGKDSTRPKAADSNTSRLDLFKKTVTALKEVFQPLLRGGLSLVNALDLALKDEGVKAALSKWAKEKSKELPDWFIACKSRGKK